MSIWNVLGVLAGLAIAFSGGFLVGMLIIWKAVKLDLYAWQAAGMEQEAKTLEAQAAEERMRKENISLLNEKLGAS